MAIKGPQDRVLTDLSFFMNVTAERGKFLIHDGAGSGISMDDTNAYVAVPTGQAPSATKPAGILLNDVVDKDLTQTHLNWHQDQVQKGGKVLIGQIWKGTTNNVTGSPTAGSVAYYSTTGVLTPTDAGSAPAVGRFLSAKDADGYAKVFINITG